MSAGRRSAGVPRLSRAVLERCVPVSQRPFVLADLEERFHELARTASPAAARRWYRAQALAALRWRGSWPLPGPLSEPRIPSVGDRFSILAAEVRLAARSLVRKPGLTALSIVALGLGIGLTATAFSVLWGTVLRGLPFEEADRLVHFERADVQEDELAMAVTPHDYVAWRSQQRSFEDLGAYVEAVIQLPSGDGPPERFSGVFIDAGSFDLLRVRPALGRAFTDEDDRPGAPDVILLGHGLWTQRFAADPDVVGTVLQLDRGPATVVGVMPEGFGFPVAEQFWLPLRLDLAGYERGSGRLDVFGRLRPGVDVEAARAEFEGISRRLAEAFPETNAGISAMLRSFRDEYVGPEFVSTVGRMLAGALLVLLVSCANVANLLLVRASDRRRETALRVALGAGRWTVLRQMLVESGLLAGAGAILGTALAVVGVGWFRVAGAQAGVFQLPHGSATLFWWDVRVDLISVAFVSATALLATILAGLAPALYGADTDVSGTLKDQARRGGGRSLTRATRALVVTEVALTTGLLVATGLVVRSVANVRGVDDAFDTEGIVTARVALPMAAMGDSEQRFPDHEARHRFATEVLTALEGSPAVADAAAATVLPSQRPARVQVALRETTYARTEDQPTVGVATVSSSYFPLFSVRAIQGRVLTPSDGQGSEPVAVVSRSFADRFFPDGPALDRMVRIGPFDGEDPWVRVVGVVPDLWTNPDGPRQETVYVPLAQSGTPDPTVRLGRWGLRYFSVAVQAAGTEAEAAAALRSAVYSVSPDVPLMRSAGMDELVAEQVGSFRVWARFYMAFGLAALFLASLGLYGVLSYAVAGRTSEIGIRRALGAGRSRVVRSVVGDAVRQVALGSALGVVLALWVAGGMNRVLFRVDPRDPLVFLAVLGVLLATGVAAALLPAGRAAAVDPATALRSD